MPVVDHGAGSDERNVAVYPQPRSKQTNWEVSD